MRILASYSKPLRAVVGSVVAILGLQASPSSVTLNIKSDLTTFINNGVSWNIDITPVVVIDHLDLNRLFVKVIGR